MLSSLKSATKLWSKRIYNLKFKTYVRRKKKRSKERIEKYIPCSRIKILRIQLHFHLRVLQFLRRYLPRTVTSSLSALCIDRVHRGIMGALFDRFDTLPRPISGHGGREFGSGNPVGDPRGILIFSVGRNILVLHRCCC